MWERNNVSLLKSLDKELGFGLGFKKRGQKLFMFLFPNEQMFIWPFCVDGVDGGLTSPNTWHQIGFSWKNSTSAGSDAFYITLFAVNRRRGGWLEE